LLDSNDWVQAIMLGATQAEADEPSFCLDKAK